MVLHVRLGFFQPLLMHVDPKLIRACPSEDFSHLEKNSVKRRVESPVIARVADDAVDLDDKPSLAADILRRSRIAGGILPLYGYLIALFELRF